MKNERLAELRRRAAALPSEPGVYIMKDREGTVLYVGKSRSLCDRVGSYFVGTHNRKTERLVASVYEFDTVLCHTEMEALVLENTLIKRHAPRFNIKLKDAKSYPYLKITSEPYPRLVITRDRRARDGEYFGPYPGMSEAHAAKDAVCRAFRLPTCRRRFPEDVGRERPCLYAAMGRCMAPCRTLPPRKDYLAMMKQVRRVLLGYVGKTVQELTESMRAAADAERFEEAARLRDTVAALSRLREKQCVVADGDVNCDAVAIAGEGGGVLSLLSVREGVLLSKRDFPFGGGELDTPDAVFAFLRGLYATAEPPRELLVGFDAGEDELSELADSLSAIAGHRVRVTTPQRGRKRKLCDMAYENARHAAERREREREGAEATLVRLASLLRLEVLPERIEAFDISELGNEAITASMVVFESGRKKKSDYRIFRIKNQKTADDCAAMREAISRRLSHVGDGSPSLGTAPDLILVDGGLTQLGAAQDAMREAGIALPVFGMVKDEFHKTRALVDGESEISIATDRGIYRLIFSIQEEAHRFAVQSMHKKKSATLRRTSLEAIPGIGPRKARLLLSHFGSVAAIRAAEVGELSALPGIHRGDAERIRAYFEKEENPT